VIIKTSCLLGAVFFGMVSLLMPDPVMAAVTRVVTHDTALCPSDGINFPCYTDLGAAITAALTGDSIEIKPGTYVGNFTINQNITSISGDETATTILTSNGSGAALTISSLVTGISIKKLNFINSPIGISVQNSQSVTITNNVFQGPNNTAVQLQNSTSSTITNNTFYQNTNGITSNLVTNTVTISNNIFSTQQTAIDPNVAVTGISYNLFFACKLIGPAISFNVNDTANYQHNLQNVDPLFVNFSASDFHLNTGSPCINTGNPSVGNNSADGKTPDMGAYGGPTADTVPFPVSLRQPTAASGSITLTWLPNTCYLVSGYRVFYGSAPGARDGTGATEGNSPFVVTADTATVTGLTTTVSTPGTPTLGPPQSLNESLVLTWSAVPSAKKYNVYYGTTSPPTTLAATVASTSYTLGGLTNGQQYFVAVTAVNQAIYYFTVTAFDSGGTGTTGATTPQVVHESDFSNEVNQSFGDPVEGSLSNIQNEFPEALTPFPDVPSGHHGCFIATAAYGHYSDPEVQALRAFRDRYLITNGPGRAFVEWYYQHSPAAAAALNAHPAWKPVVRAALLPAVGGAYLLTRTSLLFRIILLAVFGCAVLFLYGRKRFTRFGGDR
jgi:parallel beta-helix repeat protein